VDRARETFVLEEKYWGPFFATKDWASLPNFWKFACTYALSVKTADFKRAGWFRRTFVYYGFEDTDLGYRLAKRGLRFYMNPMVTYHLDSGEDRTEYRRSALFRQALLNKTAKIFYLNTLDPVVYRHFSLYMGGDLDPKAYLRTWWRGFARSVEAH
jgi:GT2 family glycosyltransferase